jgi:hypothetical protein
MNTLIKYFGGSIIFAIVALCAVYIETGNPLLLGTVLTLAVIEIALSFDNAVVNAAQLSKMSVFWKKMFLYVGIFIAVIGMRVLFPVGIVSIVGDVSMQTALDWALTNPTQFEHTLISSHAMVAGFGGAFLSMVFLSFFMDKERDEFWLAPIEKPLAAIGSLDMVQAMIVGSLSYAVSLNMEHGGHEFFMAALAGMITFGVIEIIKHLLEGATDEATANTVGTVAKAGLGAFIYIEILDSAFSADGVLAAFAISSNVFVIAAGLGIGAMFVRSMTVMLDATGTLKTYQYLETGAFWSIGFLSASIMIEPFLEIPDYMIALTSVSIIIASVIHSAFDNRQEESTN